MTRLRKKGFTLIELIAVLVIMAIIALIVTPLLMNVIRKARVAADKRSIDAYGRSIEYAIAGYLLDNGKFPTDVSQLTIEYSGNEVVCSTTQLNSDSSVYLTGCTVGGRTVDYAYGSDKTPPAPTYTAYSVGDHVSYNGITYYVIENSDTMNDTVKLLKETPFLKTEIDNLNLTDITIREENSYGTVYYGAYPTLEQSNVGRVIIAWKNNAVRNEDTATVRLLTKEELESNFEFEDKDCCDGCGQCIMQVIKDSFMYDSDFSYWTMTYVDRAPSMYIIGTYGQLTTRSYGDYAMIRPVLEISKTAELTKLDS